MAAAVVEQQAEAPGKPRRHGVPDAQVGAQRIGKHQRRRPLGAEEPMMKHDAVHPLKRHGRLLEAPLRFLKQVA